MSQTVSRARPYVDVPVVLPRGCGRSGPPVHLFEAGELFEARRYWRASYPAVCGAEVPAPDGSAVPADDEDECCAGCADCHRYCAACTLAAARFAEHDPQ